MTSQLAPGLPRAAGQARRGPVPSGSWLLGFAAFQFGCQLVLLLSWVGSFRAIVRTVAFLASIGLALALPGRSRGGNSMRAWVYAILAILFLECLNPEGSGVIPSLAQIGLYLAILGPLLWVPRLKVTPRTLQRLVLLMWAFYSISAVFGVLQAYFPGHFQPPLSMFKAGMDRDRLRSLQIELASGEHVLRPMGLTDNPGGAAYGGMYAVLLSVAIVQLPKSFWGARSLAITSMVVGMMCLYLCQVRAAIVTLGICLFTMLIVLALARRASRMAIAALVVGAVIPLAFALAFSVGGHSVTDRLSTLVENDAATVYYEHRGKFLEHTVNDLLPQYPLGAGLGRWGMTNLYFSTIANSIWVEIQWTGWLLDGGLPLILAYCGIIVLASWKCFKVAMGRRGSGDGSLATWGSVLVAYNVGAFALCFSYPVFIGTLGLEFWLLNAALIQSADQIDLAPRQISS